MERADHEQWKSSEVARLLALVESERRYYQDVFAVLPVAIALIDADWRLSAVNREFRRRFGLQHEDLSRVRLPDLIPDAALEAALQEVVRTGLPLKDHPVRLGPDASPRHLKISIQKTQGWQAGSEDELLLTFDEQIASVSFGPPAAAPEPAAPPPESPDAAAARRKAQRQSVEEAKRAAVERLSGRLAHVSNNLLMIIGGYAEELIESLPAGDSRREDVEHIIKAASRMGALTRDLTTLTRPPVYDASDFVARPWVESVATRLQILYVPVEPALRIRTSPLLLEQLCVEAVRYWRAFVPPDTEITLRAAVLDDQRATVSLWLPPDVLPSDAAEKIFEPFTGAKEGTDPPLGLAGLILPWRALEGDIDFDPATGRLELTCPRVQPPPEPEYLATILLVEDEPGIRSWIARNLERHKYRVLEAAAPAEALRIQGELAQPADLLITDLMIPGMNGRELAEALRQDWPHCRALFISGYTNDPELTTRLGSGNLAEGTRFLAKPFNVANLLAEVKALLQQP
jgi:CheY-like chemotaxis protein/signal transduction histidine kinase